MKLNKNTKIAIISHFTFKESEQTEVFPGNIRNFLLDKVRTLTYIDHPFIQSQNASSDFLSSQMRIYTKGVKTYEVTAPKLKLPSLVLFIYQLILTIFFLLKKPMKYDLCIACDNLSLISVFFLRKFGLIKRLVYYTVDYSPKRYNNPVLNTLYQSMDRLANRISDVNWVVVENMITAKAQNGLNIEKCSPFQIVPIGFSKKDIIIKSINKTDSFNLIFVGILFEKQGLQLVIKVLPKLIKEFPKVRLTIIGSGPQETEIKKMVEKADLSSFVNFTGYINNHQKIVRLLTHSGGIGLATYVPAIGDYTYNADPSKIKLYLACGMPVITTSVPPIAKKIANKKAGFVIDYSEEALLEVLTSIFQSEKTYAVVRNNAIMLGNEYDTNKILKKSFQKLL